MDFTGIELHQSLVLVVPALLIIGFVMKQTPKCPDWAIIWAILVLGTIAGIITIGATVNGVTNGIIAAGLAITSNQVYKQATKKKKK